MEDRMRTTAPDAHRGAYRRHIDLCRVAGTSCRALFG